MGEKIVQLNSLKNYNKHLQEAYIKPLEEMAKDLPKVERIITELANGEFTSEPQEVFGYNYGVIIPLQVEIKLTEEERPKILNVTLDENTHNGLQVAYIPSLGYYVVGNLSILNPLIAEAGVQFNNTGEPFVMALTETFCLLATDFTLNTYNIKIDAVTEKVKKLDSKFIQPSDWNQQNPKDGGYIKNKPCGIQWALVEDDINEFETEPIIEYKGAYVKYYIGIRIFQIFQLLVQKQMVFNMIICL